MEVSIDRIKRMIGDIDAYSKTVTVNSHQFSAKIVNESSNYQRQPACREFGYELAEHVHELRRLVKNLSIFSDKCG